MTQYDWDELGKWFWGEFIPRLFTFKKKKEKRKDITDFRHTKPCGYCGSTHGCNCQAELTKEAEGNNFNSWNL